MINEVDSKENDSDSVVENVVKGSSDTQSINNLINGYTIMLEQYTKLKNDLINVSNYINSGDIGLCNALKAFSQSYSINGTSADSGKLEGVIKDIDGVKDYLSVNVMPAIEEEIADLKRRIASLQAQL